MTLHKLNKKITCTDQDVCIKNIISKISHLGTFMATKENDIVNGHVSISHENNNHVIWINVYDKNELPNSKHKSEFKKLKNEPSKRNLDDII